MQQSGASTSAEQTDEHTSEGLECNTSEGHSDANHVSCRTTPSTKSAKVQVRLKFGVNKG